MKILAINNKVKNQEVISTAWNIVAEELSSIGYSPEITPKTTNKQLTSYNFSNQAVGNAVAIHEHQILDEVDGVYKVAVMIFNADEIAPRPTNPVQYPVLRNGCNPIAIPEFWYGGNARVLADYILHELCHSGFFFKGDVPNDSTHLMNNYNSNPVEYLKWASLPINKYYLHLLSNLKPFLETQNKPISSPVNAPKTLKMGSRSVLVTELQQLLRSKGYFLVKPTGYFGSFTDRAVRNFQKANGLVVDGIVGEKTWGMLK